MAGTHPFPEGYALGAFAHEVRTGRPTRIGDAILELAANLIPAADRRIIEQKIYARRGVRMGLRSFIPADLTRHPSRSSGRRP